MPPSDGDDAVFPLPVIKERLLAQAHLDRNQPDEARRFDRAATGWPDRYCAFAGTRLAGA